MIFRSRPLYNFLYRSFISRPIYLYIDIFHVSFHIYKKKNIEEEEREG